MLDMSEAGLLLGTEAWLSLEVDNFELALYTKYKMYRSDRVRSKEGGVTKAVRKSLHSESVEVRSFLDLRVWIRVRLWRFCLLCICYHLPCLFSQCFC